jgi:hypothetical protein
VVIRDEAYFRLLAETSHPDENLGGAPLERVIEVLQGDGEHVRRLVTYRRSQAAKKAWDTKRFNFERGIKRFHRHDLAKDIRKKVADRLKKYSAHDVFTGRDGNKYEGFRVVLPEYDRYEFARDLALLEAAILEEAAVYALEEEHAECVVFAEDASRALAFVRRAVLFETGIRPEHMESVLAAVGHEYLGETFCGPGPYVPAFSTLIRESAHVRQGDADDGQTDGPSGPAAE